MLLLSHPPDDTEETKEEEEVHDERNTESPSNPGTVYTMNKGERRLGLLRSSATGDFKKSNQTSADKAKEQHMYQWAGLFPSRPTGPRGGHRLPDSPSTGGYR